MPAGRGRNRANSIKQINNEAKRGKKMDHKAALAKLYYDYDLLCNEFTGKQQQ